MHLLGFKVDEYRSEPAMLSLAQGDLARICQLIAQRELMPRDGAVYLALLSFLNPVDCRVRIRASFIADRVGMQEKHVISSITRLCNVKHVHRLRDAQGEPVLQLLSPGGGPFPMSISEAI